MSKVVFSSLKTAVKGSAMLVVAIAAGQVLWFLIRILIVRNISQFDFGIYSLAMTIVSITAVVFTVSLSEGTARFISVSGGAAGEKKRRGIIKSGLQMVFSLGVVATAVFYFYSGYMSFRVFDMPSLAPALRVIAPSVILAMLLDMFVSIFRGFGNVAPKALADMAQPLIYIVLLSAIFMLGLPFISVFYAFLLALLLVVGGLSVYAQREIGLRNLVLHGGKTFRRELFLFSLPLMGITFHVLIMTWTDTLMIGYFMNAEDVGLYNVAASLSRALTFPIVILNFVFMPIAGELYVKGQMYELKRTFQVLTKWLFMVSFPVFLILFFFPEMTLQFLFGLQYVPGSSQLKILSLRFMLELVVGPGVLLLTVFGRTRLLMWIAVTGSVLNIVLNYTLIPVLGLSGAALATLLAALVGLCMCTGTLYALNKIQPFTPRYVKPAVASSIIAVIIYAIAKSFPLYFWMMPIYFGLFVGGYVLSILFTRSIEKEDIYIFEAITKKLGLELTFLRKLLYRFAHE